MNKQRGSALAIVIGVLVVVVAIGALLFTSYVSAYNYGNRAEQSLKGVKSNNENILAQYGQKVQEAAQVPDMMKKDMVEVVTAAVQGRYGPDGSKATFQWLKEQNPNLDPQLYRQIQQIIEGGRNDFQNGQTRLIDQKAMYQTALGSFWQGMWLGVAGYPKINLDEFKPVTTDRASNAFQTGKEEGPIKLR